MPKALERQAVERELLRRKNATFLKRMAALRAEENVFYQAQARRPQKGKFRNRVWAEQCGGVGSFVATVHTPNSYIHVACKVKQF